MPSKNNPFLLELDWPELPPHFGACSTMRSGGFSQAPYDDGSGQGGGGFNLGDHVGDSIQAVSDNRAKLAEFLSAQPHWLTQVHGVDVVQLNSTTSGKLIADASFTIQPKVVCAVLTADCLPVLFCDPKNGVVAAAHAGWRGLVDGVLERTVQTMQQAGAQVDELLVWLGPAIGPLNFEVGAEVRERFVTFDPISAQPFQPSEARTEKFYANIYTLARQRLSKLGVQHISGGSHCTVQQATQFFSYRRDGVTGRMASLIWIK